MQTATSPGEMQAESTPSATCPSRTGVAPVLMILGMGAITYGYYTYIIDKSEKGCYESDEDSDDSPDESNDETNSNALQDHPKHRWPPQNMHERRIDVHTRDPAT